MVVVILAMAVTHHLPVVLMVVPVLSTPFTIPSHIPQHGN